MGLSQEKDAEMGKIVTVIIFSFLACLGAGANPGQAQSECP